MNQPLSKSTALPEGTKARGALLATAAVAAVLLSADNAFAADGWWNGTETAPFAGGVIRRAHCDLAWFIEGTFGGMVMTAAAVVALAAAALGSLKQMHGMMISGMGAATITACVSLYFGNFNCANKLSPPEYEQARTAGISAEALAIAAGRELPDTSSDEIPSDTEETESDGDPFGE